MTKPNVIVIGDCGVNRHYTGAVTGISPDAACPLVKTHNVVEVPNGAANVVMNLVGLGRNCSFITVLGGKTADIGTEILRQWFTTNTHVTLHAYHRNDYITPIHTRVCANNGQQLIRFDIADSAPYPIDMAVNNAIWTKAEALLQKASENGRPTILVLVDSGNGIFDEDDLTSSILAVAQELSIPTVVSTPRQNITRFMPATLIIKPTEDIPIDKTVLAMAESMFKPAIPNVGGLLLVGGSSGMVLTITDQMKPITHIVQPYPRTDVVNTCGAIDTITAISALHLTCTKDEYAEAAIGLRDIVKRASVAAGVVMTQAGTCTIEDWEYETALGDNHVIPAIKLAGISEATVILDEARKAEEEIVFVDGSFNGLCSGHIHLLQQARRLGDILVVGLRTDASIRQKYGDTCAVIPELHRVGMLEALSCVDMVILFDEESSDSLLRLVKPDYLVRGQEHLKEDVTTVPGVTYMIQRDKSIVFIEMLDGVGKQTEETEQ